jgi:hypothetical protein
MAVYTQAPGAILRRGHDKLVLHLVSLSETVSFRLANGVLEMWMVPMLPLHIKMDKQHRSSGVTVHCTQGLETTFRRGSEALVLHPASPWVTGSSKSAAGALGM